jgi:hypothetical protein
LVEIARDACFIGTRKITVAFRFKAHGPSNLPVMVKDDDLDLFVLAPGAIAHPARHDFSALRTKANPPLKAAGNFLVLLVHPSRLVGQSGARLGMRRVDRF